MNTTLVITIIGSAALVALMSFSGVLVTSRILKKKFQSRMALLVSFAAGVFVVAGGSLGIEALHLMNWQGALIYFIGSLIVFHVLSLVWPEHHEHGQEGVCDHCEPRRDIARRLVIGDGIHNVVDGILLVSTFLVSTNLGFATLVAILLHEIVQEVSEYIVFRKAGYSVRAALTINALTASTIFVGVGAALIGQQYISGFEGPLMAISAGAFVYIALRDLVPHSVMHTKKNKKPLRHVVAFLFGLVVMWAAGQVVLHYHGPDQNHDHEHEYVDEESHEAHDHDHLQAPKDGGTQEDAEAHTPLVVEGTDEHAHDHDH